MLVEAILNNSRGTKLDVDVSIEKFLGKTKKISCLSNSLSWISTDKASHISKKNLGLLEDSSYHITATIYSYGSYVSAKASVVPIIELELHYRKRVADYNKLTLKKKNYFICLTFTDT